MTEAVFEGKTYEKNTVDTDRIRLAVKQNHLANLAVKWATMFGRKRPSDYNEMLYGFLIRYNLARPHFLRSYTRRASFFIVNGAFVLARSPSLTTCFHPDHWACLNPLS